MPRSNTSRAPRPNCHSDGAAYRKTGSVDQTTSTATTRASVAKCLRGAATATAGHDQHVRGADAGRGDKSAAGVKGMNNKVCCGWNISDNNYTATACSTRNTTSSTRCATAAASIGQTSHA